MEPEVMKAQAESVGLDWDAVKRGAERLLPAFKAVAAITPNKYDDAFVKFVEQLLQAN